MSDTIEIRTSDFFQRLCEVYIDLQENLGLDVQEITYNREEQTGSLFVLCPIFDENGARESWEDDESMHQVILQEYIETTDDCKLRKTDRDEIAEIYID